MLQMQIQDPIAQDPIAQDPIAHLIIWFEQQQEKLSDLNPALQLFSLSNFPAMLF